MVMDPVIEMNSSESKIDLNYFNSTPTVVENFKLPNSGINKDGPFLKIIEQPQTKFRFRYKSEMAGTHGQLKAESSDKNKATFPTVKLCNWDHGPALVRLTLYTAEENANDRRRHVHELSGKNCNKEGFTGGCEVVVDEKNNYSAVFPNLGIIHIAKREVPSIIFQRKKEEIIKYQCNVYPNEGIQHNIPPTEIKRLKSQAEEESKSMDLNKVVLRFQAFFFNTKSNCYQEIAQHIDSEIIYNLKNASTGELKIVRISAASAPCSGGTEIWMLVEKVKKNNVRIKFFELDQDDREMWSSYGEFKPESDVHHQYAIVFKTPAYRSSVHHPIHVKIQLERPSDGDTSESIDFTFTPENLKRPTPCMDALDSRMSPSKRPKQSEPLDLKSGHLFLASGDLNLPNIEAFNQQPPTSPRVPSPMSLPDSPASKGFYSPPYPGTGTTPTHDEFILSPQSTEGGIIHEIGNQPIIVTTLPDQSFTFIPAINGGASNLTISEGFVSPPHFEREEAYHTSRNYVMPSSSPNHQVPSPYERVMCSPNQLTYEQLQYQHEHESAIIPSTVPPVFEANETFQQIQQFNATYDQVVKSKTQMDHYDFSDLACPNNQNSDMDLLNVITNTNLFSTTNGFGNDIQPDYIPSKEKAKKESSSKENSAPVTSNGDIDLLANSMAKMSFSKATSAQKGAQNKQQTNEYIFNRDIAFRVALKAAECLQAYAASGETSFLLAAHRYLLGVQNNQGDNSLHIAINNKNFEAFKKIMQAATDVYCSQLLLNAQNLAGETPLHTAMKEEEPMMIHQLLSSCVCKFDLVDLDGNSCLHVAAQHANHLCLSLLLTQPAVASSNSLGKVINMHNFNGKTPLHLAVNSGCLNKVKLLLQAGADVHACERKQGANSLHLAAMLQNVPIAKYLINHTSITVNARMFDGNAALHIAAQAAHPEICTLLMKAKANPQAKNSIKKQSRSFDSEPEDDEEEIQQEIASTDANDEKSADDDFYTPVDYAQDNEEVLSILQGNYDQAASFEEPASTRTVNSHEADKGGKNHESSNLDSGIDISSSFSSECLTPC